MTVERVAKETMNINYFGTINVSNALFPLLRSNARVVNVSSKLGLLTRVVSEELRKKIADPSNSIEQISQIANDYIK
jgi:carbonyl reductase 1